MLKTEKVVFMSKLILFDENNKLLPDGLKIIERFKSNDIKIIILAKATTNRNLKNKIPIIYKENIFFWDRSDKSNKEILTQNIKSGAIISAMIGVVDNDAIFSFHCKLPLFNPGKIIDNRVAISEKVEKYGLPFFDFETVIKCFFAYEAHKEKYFHIVSNNYSYEAISLYNANTYYRPENEKIIKKIFETQLKSEINERNHAILILLLFSLINEVTTNRSFDEVNYWGTFPSSKSLNIDTSAAFIKESIRVIVGGGPRNGPEIFIRVSDMEAKHEKGTELRIHNRCEKDFETLIINPKIETVIKGKVVCIIDDYITYGHSAEAAKNLLFSAGVSKIIFLSMGKFGKKYYYSEYLLTGNFTLQGYNYSYSSGGLRRAYFENGKTCYNPNSDKEILNFLPLI